MDLPLLEIRTIIEHTSIFPGTREAMARIFPDLKRVCRDLDQIFHPSFCLHIARKMISWVKALEKEGELEGVEAENLKNLKRTYRNFAQKIRETSPPYPLHVKMNKIGIKKLFTFEQIFEEDVNYLMNITKFSMEKRYERMQAYSSLSHSSYLV